MSLAICTLTSDGIVMTADSRQTYTNVAGAIRIGSDNGNKLFQLNERVGVAVAGLAFLLEDENTIKSIGWFIEQFKKSTLKDEKDLKKIAESLNSYVADKQIESLKIQIKGEVRVKGGSGLSFQSNRDKLPVKYSYRDSAGNSISEEKTIDLIQLIIAGIDKDGIGKAISTSTPNGIVAESNTIQCGALWIGQIDVLIRIINGYTPEIGALDFFSKADTTAQKAISKDLEKLAYNISWNTMTLQDAVDLCVLITKTTENVQRFSDGTALMPGGIPGVGGSIDIALITSEKGYLWLKQKEIKSEDASININDFKDLKVVEVVKPKS